MNTNGSYLVKYSQLNVELLAEEFEANCNDYDLNNEHGLNRIRSDCINQCFAKNIYEKYHAKFPTETDYLIRREISFVFDNFTYDNSYGDEYLDFCENKCKID